MKLPPQVAAISRGLRSRTHNHFHENGRSVSCDRPRSGSVIPSQDGGPNSDSPTECRVWCNILFNDCSENCGDAADPTACQQGCIFIYKVCFSGCDPTF